MTRRDGGLTFVFGDASVALARAGGDLAIRLAYTAAYRNGPTPRLMAWHSTWAAAVRSAAGLWNDVREGTG